MINDVINGITEALSQEFPTTDGYAIYAGDLPQGFKPKTFLVTEIMPGKDQKNFSTYEYTNLIAIQYRPQNGHNEINNIAMRLQDCLRIINVTHDEITTKTRLEQTNFAVVDGIMTYTVRHSDVYFALPQGDNMANIDIGVKHGE